MLKFALMINNTVSNIIVGDSLESVSVLGTCIEIPEGESIGIGYIWDGNKFVEKLEEVTTIEQQPVTEEQPSIETPETEMPTIETLVE
jgi:hypothetical protein